MGSAQKKTFSKKKKKKSKRGTTISTLYVQYKK